MRHDSPWVHGTLDHWAARQPDACALRLVSLDERPREISYRALQSLTTGYAARLKREQAPGTCLLTPDANPQAQLLECLGVIASGRCAAVPDPDWPPAVHQQIVRYLAALNGHSPAGEQARSVVQAGDTFDIPNHAGTGHEPFYIGFTSGSTGLPKGFRRHHRSWVESFRVSLADFGEQAAGHVLAPGRLSHSLFLFGALLGIWSGGGTTLQQRFSAEQVLALLAGGKHPMMVAVPSQLILMLAAARRRSLPPIPQLKLLLISGARWAREHTRALRALFPAARIITFYGASETSYVSWMDVNESAPVQAVGRPFSNVQLHVGETPDSPPDQTGEPGRIWVRSPMLFTDYINPDDDTAAVRHGDWLSVHDMGHLDEHGILHLCGRANRMIVTQAKNLFPEEVESCLSAHPAIAQASVHGLADEQRGHSVHAVVQLADAAGEATPGPRELALWCQQHLERFKTPRHWWRWQGPWPQTASGKTDHARIAALLQARLPAPSKAQAPARMPQPAPLEAPGPVEPWDSSGPAPAVGAIERLEAQEQGEALQPLTAQSVPSPSIRASARPAR
ncbi:MAG: AMP-binding protein [Lautropia sp.]|nr:AMP-binding protein [Lautropia sp.]